MSATPLHAEPMSPSGFGTPSYGLSHKHRKGSRARFDGDTGPAHPMPAGVSGAQAQRLHDLMASYLPSSVRGVQRSIINHIEHTLALTRYNFNNSGCYRAVAYSVRDRLIESWNDTQQYFTEKDVKRVYYLSLEFLMGRSLQNALMNLDLKSTYEEAVRQLGYKLEDLYDEEKDAALGNGGLGRLAACFMDSLATLDYPAWGYGIRYQYGMFEQRIKDGAQVEVPDYWLTFGNPWEIERLDVTYPVRFFGTVSSYKDNGRLKFKWEGGEVVTAVAYDVPIPGYDTWNTINIRLWSSRAAKEFDLGSFNQGDYFKAIEDKQKSENISSVLYPADATWSGKTLRLQQQYFFCSATIRDVLRRFKKKPRDLKEIPNKVAMQLNDTHPTIGIVELMRILLDEEELDWDAAWDIVTKVFAYTNHTVLPEALEKWPVDLISQLLPRHMQIINEINRRWLMEVEKRFRGDGRKMEKLSIFEESGSKMVRMANLAIVGSHAVNGVAAIHSEIIKSTIFPDFVTIFPNKFQNKTNGITPRRWLGQCNPALTSLCTKWLEDDSFLTNLDALKGLRAHINNPDFRREWADVKLKNKQRLAALINKTVGVQVDCNALFDIQVKRIHEYKRQFLNILSVIHRYLVIKDASQQAKADMVPRVCVFGGKAAPSYVMAKRVIRLIGGVQQAVNNDPAVGNLLKVVFLPNYNVSQCEVIVPANDISQHISTAGTEASGTSCMKFSLNGGIILGTLDGANIEIREEVGDDNMIVFGLKAHEIENARHEMKFGGKPVDGRLQRVVDTINKGWFGPADYYGPLLGTLYNGNDFYLVGADFASYLDAQNRVDNLYKDKEKWIRMSVMNTAGGGKFNSDRTIHEYARDIWNIQPCPRPAPQ
eukprot:tig00020553_g10662.t1